MKNKLSLLVLLLCAAQLGADTCLAPTNPIPVRNACGSARDMVGDPVAGLKLQLLAKNTVVAETTTDANGKFMFATQAPGDYDLASASEEWRVFWPIRVENPKSENKCKHPLEVRLSVGSCGNSVSKKGYHPKFSR